MESQHEEGTGTASTAPDQDARVYEKRARITITERAPCNCGNPNCESNADLTDQSEEAFAYMVVAGHKRQEDGQPGIMYLADAADHETAVRLTAFLLSELEEQGILTEAMARSGIGMPPVVMVSGTMDELFGALGIGKRGRKPEGEQAPPEAPPAYEPPRGEA